MGRLFGTDGVRGVANQELTPELAFDLGRAGACVLASETNKKPKVLIGMDGRASGHMLENALTAGMCSVGAEVTSVGILPTPAIAYLVRLYNYDAGVVISASHNPAKYNGIKFFNAEGYKLSDSLENEIEDLIFNKERLAALPRPIGGEVGGKCELPSEALKDYVSFLKSKASCDFSSHKVVLDCANGASSKVAPLAFMDLGAEVTAINNEPNGTNINKDCGSTHMEGLCAAVKKLGADVGFAFDGDADRCLAVDESGEIVDGDQLLCIFANFMKENKSLKDDTVVATVMSNLGLFIMGRERSLNIEQTAVGDRYVLELMLEKGYNLGGEQSGHIIFLDDNTTGDGVLSAIKTLSIMKTTGKKLSELAAQMTVLPQALVNAQVSNEKKSTYMNYGEIRSAIEALEKKYEAAGRVLIRTSGTEPLVRVMIEGRNADEISQDAQTLAALIEQKLN